MLNVENKKMLNVEDKTIYSLYHDVKREYILLKPELDALEDKRRVHKLLVELLEDRLMIMKIFSQITPHMRAHHQYQSCYGIICALRIEVLMQSSEDVKETPKLVAGLRKRIKPLRIPREVLNFDAPDRIEAHGDGYKILGRKSNEVQRSIVTKLEEYSCIIKVWFENEFRKEHELDFMKAGYNFFKWAREYTLKKEFKPSIKDSDFTEEISTSSSELAGSIVFSKCVYYSKFYVPYINGFKRELDNVATRYHRLKEYSNSNIKRLPIVPISVNSLQMELFNN